MKILEEARGVLEPYGYVLSSSAEGMLQFEDETLLGFICDGPLDSILESWREKQDRFLKRNAPLLQRSALKSWNLYSVFLSSDAADDSDRKALLSIEEDFRATRKIVHTEVNTRADVVRALYPFIPIQNIVSLDIASSIQILRKRLDTIPPGAVDILLDETANDNAVLRRFQEAHDIKAD